MVSAQYSGEKPLPVSFFTEIRRQPFVQPVVIQQLQYGHVFICNTFPAEYITSSHTVFTIGKKSGNGNFQAEFQKALSYRLSFQF
jgi:hypothetical protein